MNFLLSLADAHTVADAHAVVALEFRVHDARSSIYEELLSHTQPPSSFCYVVAATHTESFLLAKCLIIAAYVYRYRHVC